MRLLRFRDLDSVSGDIQLVSIKKFYGFLIEKVADGYRLFLHGDKGDIWKIFITDSEDACNSVIANILEDINDSGDYVIDIDTSIENVLSVRALK